MALRSTLAFAAGRWGIAILALAVGFAVGCGVEPTPRAPLLGDHYDQLRGGMSLAEVQSLLGPGRPLTGADDLGLHIQKLPAGAQSRVWQDGRTSITIAFVAGKSVAKLRAVAPARDK